MLWLGNRGEMQLDDVATIIGKAEFFDICDIEQNRLLAFASERRQLDAGDVLYRSGDTPDGAFILISGRLNTVPDKGENTRPYVVREPGSVVGAMSLLIAKPRAVTVSALVNSDVLFVPRYAFLKLVRQYPDLAARAAARIEADLANYLKAVDPARRKLQRDQS